jgi:hypothetical protein
VTRLKRQPPTPTRHWYHPEIRISSPLRNIAQENPLDAKETFFLTILKTPKHRSSFSKLVHSCIELAEPIPYVACTPLPRHLGGPQSVSFRENHISILTLELADKDGPTSVNEILNSLRKTQITADERPASTLTTPTLPPQIRHLLSQPETPPPRTRVRRRYDESGRVLPAGPAPPRSWLKPSGYESVSSSRLNKLHERKYPDRIQHLPGIAATNSRTLQDMCLRRMAGDWEFMRQYERNNLADLPTCLRMSLLSNIAMYGPEEGVGFEGLKTLLMPPEHDERGELIEHQDDTQLNRNDDFFRLDLSGSAGRSINLKHLSELLEKPLKETEEAEESWEESFTRSLSPVIPHLTHLSLSHAPHTISWSRLLSLSKNIPALTHLSLAYWPAPSLTPNSKTTIMSPKLGGDIPYGGTNYYSHTIFGDYREAASILRRLANSKSTLHLRQSQPYSQIFLSIIRKYKLTHSALYGLEYLDLTGCHTWTQALVYKCEGEPGIDWTAQWAKLSILSIASSLPLSPSSTFQDVNNFRTAVSHQRSIERILNKARKPTGRWLDVRIDDYMQYEYLWRNGQGEDGRKRRELEGLWRRDFDAPIDPWLEEQAPTRPTVHRRRSMWDRQ